MRVDGGFVQGAAAAVTWALLAPSLGAQPAPSPTQQAAPSVAPHVISADGVLLTDDLLELARRTQTAHVDQFTEAPADAYEGRPFYARAAGPAYVTYDLPTHTLTAGTRRYGEMSWTLEGPAYNKITTYVGQNSYGAKANVAVVEGRRTDLAGQDVRENMDEVSQPNSVAYTATLSPEAARELSHNLAWMIAGRLTRAQTSVTQRPGVVSIEESVSQPTVSEPNQSHFVKTTLHAVVAKVMLVDTASGKLLFTYDVPLPAR